MGGGVRKRNAEGNCSRNTKDKARQTGWPKKDKVNRREKVALHAGMRRCEHTSNKKAHSARGERVFLGHTHKHAPVSLWTCLLFLSSFIHSFSRSFIHSPLFVTAVNQGSQLSTSSLPPTNDNIYQPRDRFSSCAPCSPSLRSPPEHRG